MAVGRRSDHDAFRRLCNQSLYDCGVKGTLSYRAEEVKYYFTRQEAGESVPVPEGTEVEILCSNG